MRLSRTAAGVCVAVVGVLLLWRPHPLPALWASCSLPVTAVCLALGCLLAYLVFYRMPPTFVDPAGKAVFITGCDSGFGYSLAHRLDTRGYRVFAGCLAPDREGAEQLKKSCSPNLQVVPLDVTDDWQVQKALKVVKDKCEEGALWAVVNNAGIAAFTEIEWCSVDQFQRILDVNVLGVVRVTKAFLPLLRTSKGRVINVASLAGRFTIPAFAAYSMSKKACIAFSDALRLEMKKFEVDVVTIEPGLYRTPIVQEEYLINLNRKSWAETPSAVKEDYGEEYFNAFLQNMTQQMKRARPNVEEVVDLMVLAVCAERPRHRYVPYWGSYLRSLVLSNSPAFLTDQLFQKMSVKVPPSARTRNSSKSSSTGTPGTPSGSVFSDTPPSHTPVTSLPNGESQS
ncbi:hypothetical protein ACOMHN_005108 [Nucella lapillus]